MSLAIQQWIVLVVMFVLVIAVVSWSATHLGKRSIKGENINRRSGNVLPSESTISFERVLQYMNSIDVFTTSEKSTMIEDSGTAVNLETLGKLTTLETLEDSSTLRTLEKSSTLVETETSEVTGASLTETNTELPEISKSFTFSTTECPDSEDYKQDEETSSSLNTQEIQEIVTGNFSI